jgi:hypothetical protein
VLAATLGLWMAHSQAGLALPQAGPGQPDASTLSNADNPEPARLGVGAGQALPVSANQHLATTVAQHLRLSGQLRHYHIDITVQNGNVELTGRVADQSQRDEAVRIAQAVPGVERVRDRLVIQGGTAVHKATATDQQSDREPSLLLRNQDGAVSQPAAPPTEPMPIFQAPPGQQFVMNPPPLPPYAWPTYAPYNNYSRVAYPTQYPYKSWPFIGPNYPFPKVPLGWRSIQLQYYDGCWWYGKTATGYDWWRIRYW